MTDHAGPPAAAPGSHAAALERIETGLGDVEHALRRLDDGTYGACEACGNAISDERLVAQPLTRTCRDDHG